MTDKWNPAPTDMLVQTRQIALLIRQAGAVPAPTDYVAFVRGAPTATQSSSR